MRKTDKEIVHELITALASEHLDNSEEHGDGRAHDPLNMFERWRIVRVKTTWTKSCAECVLLREAKRRFL